MQHKTSGVAADGLRRHTPKVFLIWVKYLEISKQKYSIFFCNEEPRPHSGPCKIIILGTPMLRRHERAVSCHPWWIIKLTIFLLAPFQLIVRGGGTFMQAPPQYFSFPLA